MSNIHLGILELIFDLCSPGIIKIIFLGFCDTFWPRVISFVGMFWISIQECSILLSLMCSLEIKNSNWEKLLDYRHKNLNSLVIVSEIRLVVDFILGSCHVDFELFTFYISELLLLSHYLDIFFWESLNLSMIPYTVIKKTGAKSLVFFYIL